MSTTKEITARQARDSREERATIQAATPTRDAGTTADDNGEFARRAYAGNFFAGPHSVFHPMLFKKQKKAAG